MKRYNEGDVFAALRRPPNTVTGAATALVDCLNICSGTTYTLTLPAASAHKGKMLGFVITATGLVTVGTKVTWSGESGLLLSDGSSWIKLVYSPVAMAATLYLASHQTGVTSGSYNKVLCATAALDNTGLMGDTTNHRIPVLRDGLYDFSGVIVFSNSSGGPGIGACDRLICGGYYDGAAVVSGELSNVASGFASPQFGPKPIQAVAGKMFELYGLQTTGSTQSFYGSSSQQCQFSVIERPAW